MFINLNFLLLKIKELKNKRNNLISDSKAQATSNLSIQPHFEEIKEKLSEAILFQSSKKEEYEILKSKLGLAYLQHCFIFYDVFV